MLFQTTVLKYHWPTSTTSLQSTHSTTTLSKHLTMWSSSSKLIMKRCRTVKFALLWKDIELVKINSKIWVLFYEIKIIWQFTHSSGLKSQEEETKQNSIRYLRAVLAHTRSAHKHRDVFQTAPHTDLIPLSCIPAFKIHMPGGLRLQYWKYFCFKPWRQANGYHKSNVQTLRNSYAGERLNFSHTESESKKNWQSILTLH